jgi:hypothetical protein
MCSIDVDWHVVKRTNQIEIRDDFDEWVATTTNSDVARTVTALHNQSIQPVKGGVIELLRMQKNKGG